MFEDDYLNNDRTFLLFSLAVVLFILIHTLEFQNFLIIREDKCSLLFIYTLQYRLKPWKRLSKLSFSLPVLSASHCFIWASFTGCNYLTIPDGMSHDAFLDRQYLFIMK